jgi:hypothetical protein
MQRVFAVAHGAQAAPHLALRPVFGPSISTRLCDIRLGLYGEIVAASGSLPLSYDAQAAESNDQVGWRCLG